jgi:hydroxyacylglutathione hydrolase
MKILDDLYAFIWRDPQANNCNTYLIKGSKTILIDPGHLHLFEPVRLELLDLSLSMEQVDLVLITHAHPDHMEAAALFGKPALIAMGQVESDYVREWTGPRSWGEAVGFEPDFFLKEGDLRIGDHTFQVLITPGHSPGSLCLYWPEKRALFTGDLIFDQGIGRTDLPGGNGDLLKKSIKRIEDLDIEYILSGHGEVIKGKKEVKTNFRMIEDYWFNYL